MSWSLLFYFLLVNALKQVRYKSLYLKKRLVWFILGNLQSSIPFNTDAIALREKNDYIRFLLLFKIITNNKAINMKRIFNLNFDISSKQFTILR